MVNSIEVILVPALMIIVGMLLKKFNILEESHSAILSKIVLNISLPALIFLNVSTADIGGEMIFLPIIAFGFSLICMAIAFIYSKIRGYSKVKTWTIIILLAMMNTAFIGYPIVLGVFGDEGFVNAIFYDMGIALILVFFGVILSTMFGGDRKEVIKNGLSFVPLWAIVFAIIFNVFNVQIGYVLENSLNYLGESAIPLIMLSLGLTINFNEFRDYLSDTVFLTLSRLIISPVILYAILSGIGCGGLLLQVSVLESAMPTAMNALVLAINYDLEVELVSSVIFVTTILSLLTLPVVMGFIA